MAGVRERVRGIALCGLAAFCVLGPAQAGSPGGSAPDVPRFRHVLVVVFENKERDEIVGNPSAPTFTALSRRYATLSAYAAATHPSLPNYLALVSGSTQGIRSNCTSCVVDGTSLADTLERAGLTWKTYAEGLPAPGFRGASAGLYVKRHNPFLYFRQVAENPARRARVVPFPQLGRDLRTGRLPSFAVVVPNLCNDMHDCPVATGDRWLRREIVPLLRAPELDGSVVFVVFDEGSSDVRGGGRVAALALGPAVRPGSRFDLPTGHYGLLRTVEDSWGLPRLGLSAGARPITGIWNR